MRPINRARLRDRDHVKPRVLDLFCGAGGVSVGWAREGYDVTGVDWEFHEDYPDPRHSLFGSPLDVSCTFLQDDAMEVLADRQFLDSFHVVVASPPCPRYSTITPAHARYRHPDLIDIVRDTLLSWGGPFVIENVEGASGHMPGAIKLCGSSFGLKARRHRLFDTGPVKLTGVPACDHARQGTPVGVYGDHAEMAGGVIRPNGTSRGKRAETLAEAREALGIEWMQWGDLTDAIPPAYSQWIARRYLELMPEWLAEGVVSA